MATLEGEGLANAMTEVFCFGVAMRHTDKDAAAVLMYHKHKLGHVLAHFIEERGSLTMVTVGEIVTMIRDNIGN